MRLSLLEARSTYLWCARRALEGAGRHSCGAEETEVAALGADGPHPVAVAEVGHEHRWIQRYGFEEVTVGKPDDDAIEDGRNSRRSSVCFRRMLHDSI